VGLWAGHLQIEWDYWESSEQHDSVLEPVVQRSPLGLARLQAVEFVESGYSADSKLEPAEGCPGHLVR
jgi:hypothetical protein